MSRPAPLPARSRLRAASPVTTLRALGSLFPEPIHLVVAAGSPIREVADLRGKRVDIGLPSSGTRYDAVMVLEAYGLRHGRSGRGPAGRVGRRNAPPARRQARCLFRDHRGAGAQPAGVGRPSRVPVVIAAGPRHRASRPATPGDWSRSHFRPIPTPDSPRTIGTVAAAARCWSPRARHRTPRSSA